MSWHIIGSSIALGRSHIGEVHIGSRKHFVLMHEALDKGHKLIHGPIGLIHAVRPHFTEEVLALVGSEKPGSKGLVREAFSEKEN